MFSIALFSPTNNPTLRYSVYSQKESQLILTFKKMELDIWHILLLKLIDYIQIVAGKSK